MPPGAITVVKLLLMLSIIRCRAVNQTTGLKYKWTRGWLSRASIKLCEYSSQDSTKLLQSEEIDVWHFHSNAVELCTIMNNDELEDRYHLYNCTATKQLVELVNLENVKERKWPEHSINLRATSATSNQNNSNSKSADSVLSEDWFTSNHNLSEIEGWYKTLAAKHSDLVFINESIGVTHRKKNIFAVHIGYGKKPSNRPKIYLQCLLHAREWISGPVCMYISFYLVRESEKKQVKKLLTELEFILVPVGNPDGYALTWFRYPQYRYWRKNLAEYNDTNCVGVDLNRNFDAHWNESGTSSNPCYATFGGRHAHSEPEVRAISAYILNHRPVYGAVDFHSYGQYVLHPYGWTSNPPVYAKRLDSIVTSLSDHIKKVNGTMYSPQSMGSVYLASGTFGDWAYKDEVAAQNVDSKNQSCYYIVPITIEMRPQFGTKLTSGFLVDPKNILPACLEVVPVVKQFSKKLLKKPLKFSKKLMMK
ncbi:carboxypeptidase B-like [Dysidea avara]|uniref:carboxypeptidase B-like n=1 Tax=Dysidea avara TaxID=196820 RepID=UPI0033284313